MMAMKEKNVPNDNYRDRIPGENTSTGWFVGIIVALTLLAIGYLVFSANSGPSTGDAPAAVVTAQ